MWCYWQISYKIQILQNMKVLGSVSKKMLLLFKFIFSILFIDQQFETIDPTFTQQDNFVAQ